MNEFDLLMHVLAGCDEALKDAFSRRMEASRRVAHAKLEQGAPIYNAERSVRNVEHIAGEFPPELEAKADSLWTSLSRMSRSVQYRYMLQARPEFKLEHEKDLVDALHASEVLTAAGTEELVTQTLGIPARVCPSDEEVISAVESGAVPAGALVIPSMYHVEQLYSRIFDKEVYINQIVRTDDHRCVALLSKQLVHYPENSIVAIAMSTPSRHGSLSQALLVFAEAKITIEHMRIRRNNGEGDLLDNMIFLDIRADLTAPETRCCLLQLKQEMPYFRVLGFRPAIHDCNH